MRRAAKLIHMNMKEKMRNIKKLPQRREKKGTLLVSVCVVNENVMELKMSMYELGESILIVDQSLDITKPL
jgi:hypothetical protein